jgi:hypothetical protein
MDKHPIFIMCVLVAIAFAESMLLKKPDGSAFIDFPVDFLSTNLTGSKNNESSNMTSQSFYKWQNEDNTWYYSGQPIAGKNIETVTVNTNTNLIQGSRREKNKELAVIGEKSKLKSESLAMPLPMTVPIEKISKMLQNANNIQQLMDDRNQQIEQAIQGR